MQTIERHLLKADYQEVAKIIKMLKEKNDALLWEGWFSLEISSRYRIFFSLPEYFDILADEYFSQYHGDLQKSFIQALEGIL